MESSCIFHGSQQPGRVEGSFLQCHPPLPTHGYHPDSWRFPCSSEFATRSGHAAGETIAALLAKHCVQSGAIFTSANVTQRRAILGPKQRSVYAFTYFFLRQPCSHDSQLPDGSENQAEYCIFKIIINQRLKTIRSKRVYKPTTFRTSLPKSLLRDGLAFHQHWCLNDPTCKPGGRGERYRKPMHSGKEICTAQLQKVAQPFQPSLGLFSRQKDVKRNLKERNEVLF